MVNNSKFWFFMILVIGLSASLSGQIRPDDFPLESSPDSSNFEVYSQKNGQIKRANLFALKKYYAPFIKSIGYVPAATGNSTHLAEMVQAPDGNVYYIDGQGNAVQLFGDSVVHTDTTLTGDGTSGNPLHVTGKLTDDQNLSDGGRSGTIQKIDIEDGTSVSFDVADNDNDPENELQTISKDSTTRIVVLSDNGGSFLDEVDDMDHDTLNEIQDLAIDTLTDSLSISQGNKVYLGYLMGRDSQKLTLVNDTLGIENGNFVYLGYLTGRDSQQLSIVNDTLWIENGNGVPVVDFDRQSLKFISKNNEIVNIGIERGDSIFINVNDADSSYINEIQDLVFDPATDSLHIQYANTVYLGSLKGDNQDLSDGGRSGTNQTINITNGNGVVFDVADNDNDPENEYQSLSISGNDLTISNGNTVTLDPNDADHNPLNELQNLSLSGTVLCISGGNCITLPSGDGSGGGGDNWGTDSVVSDSTLTGNGTAADTLRVNLALSVFQAQNLNYNSTTNELSIDRGNTVTLNPNDADSDPSNEIQTISKSGSTVTLSNGGGSFTDEVDDADADPNNEIETASNIGTGAEVYKQKTGNNFEFRKLKSSDGSVTITQNANDIDLKSNASGGGDNWGSQVVETDGSLTGDGTSANPLAFDPITVNTFDDNHQFHLPDGLGNTIAFDGEDGVEVYTPSNGSHVVRVKNTWRLPMVSGNAYVGIQSTVNYDVNYILDTDYEDDDIKVVCARGNGNIILENGSYSYTIDGANTHTVNSGTCEWFQYQALNDNWYKIATTASGSGGGDNWGSQVVQTGGGLTGDGTGANPLTAVDQSATNEIETASNIGTGAEVYKQKTGNNFEFRKLRSSDGSVTITQNANDIDLKATGSGGGDNWGSQVVQTDATLTGDGTSANPLSVVGGSSNDDGDWTVSGSNLYPSVGGFVGIGTTDPDYKLHVSGGSGIGKIGISGGGNGYIHAGLFLESTGANRGLGTYMYNSANSAVWYAGNPYSYTDGFSINRKAGTLTTAAANITNSLFYISSNGDVGIGNHTPAYTLDVSGNARFTSNVKIGNYTLPTNDGVSGQVLTTNGSGSVTWQDVSGGSGGGDNWGSQVVQTNGGLTGDGTSANPLAAVDQSTSNELQTISKSGSTVTLSNGGGSFTDEVNDADADPNNEDNTASNLGSGANVFKQKSGLDLQFRSLVSSDNSVTITQNANEIDLKATGSGGGDNWGSQVVQTNGGLTGDGTGANPLAAVDQSASNELQTISKSGSTVTLSDGGGSFTDEVNDADADPNNEIETASNVGTGSSVYKQKTGNNFEFRKLKSSDGSITITQNTNDIDLTVDTGGDNWGSQVVQTNGGLTGDGTGANPLAAVDQSASNELQTISKSGSTVTLSDGGGSFTDEVDDADADPNNEIQNLDQVTTQGNTTTNDITTGNINIEKLNPVLNIKNSGSSQGEWDIKIDDSNDDLIVQSNHQNSNKIYFKNYNANIIFDYNLDNGNLHLNNTANKYPIGFNPSLYEFEMSNDLSQSVFRFNSNTQKIWIKGSDGNEGDVIGRDASGKTAWIYNKNAIMNIKNSSVHNLSTVETIVPFSTINIDDNIYMFDNSNDKIIITLSGIYEINFSGILRSYNYEGNTNTYFKITATQSGNQNTIYPVWQEDVYNESSSEPRQRFVNLTVYKQLSPNDEIKVISKGNSNLRIEDYYLTIKRLN